MVLQDEALRLRRPLGDLTLVASISDPGGCRLQLNGFVLCSARWDSISCKLVPSERFENRFPDVFISCVPGGGQGDVGVGLFPCPVFSCDVYGLKTARSAALRLLLPTEIPLDVCVITCVRLLVSSSLQHGQN